MRQVLHLSGVRGIGRTAVRKRLPSARVSESTAGVVSRHSRPCWTYTATSDHRMYGRCHIPESLHFLHTADGLVPLINAGLLEFRIGTREYHAANRHVDAFRVEMRCLPAYR